MVKNLERESELLCKVAHGLLGRRRIDADGDDLEPGRSELAIQPFDARHLHATWLAPRGPYVHEKNASLVIAQRLRSRRGVDSNRSEIRRRGTDGAREQLVPDKQRSRREREAAKRDDGGDAEALLAVRHREAYHPPRPLRP